MRATTVRITLSIGTRLILVRHKDGGALARHLARAEDAFYDTRNEVGAVRTELVAAARPALIILRCRYESVSHGTGVNNSILVLIINTALNAVSLLAEESLPN